MARRAYVALGAAGLALAAAAPAQAQETATQRFFSEPSWVRQGDPLVSGRSRPRPHAQTAAEQTGRVELSPPKVSTPWETRLDPS